MKNNKDRSSLEVFKYFNIINSSLKQYNLENMGGCKVKNCFNRTENNYAMYRVPTGERKVDWEIVLKVPLKPTDRICQVFFL